jgi:hypothetical protein
MARVTLAQLADFDALLRQKPCTRTCLCSILSP